MHRRKEESNGRKGRWQLGRPTNKLVEESSGQTALMTSSVCSEASGSKALDFGLPKWESPNAANIQPDNNYGKKGSTSPSKRQDQRGGEALKQEEPCAPKPCSLGRSGSGHPNFENMIITVDTSESSIDDELTYCDFSVTSASNYNNLTYGRTQQVRPTEADEGAAAAQMAQEEEMIRLAIEQSLQEENRRKGPASNAGRRQSFHQPSTRPTIPQQEHRRNSSAMESNVVHTDAKTGAKFMWKRVNGGRFRKVPVNEDGTLGDEEAAGIRGTCGEQILDEKLDDLEQRMLEEAMERSLADGQRTRLQQEEIKAQGISEEDMLKIAMERSLQDAQSVAAVASHTSTASPATVLRTNGDNNKDFVWKKGPNNRYYKVPVSLEQVNESEEYHQGSETREMRLARMERDMLEEAMERSLVETTRW